MSSSPIPRPGILTRLLIALVPSPCLLCGSPGREALCAPCRHQFFGSVLPRCRRCAIPVGTDVPLCGQCIAEPPNFHRTVTACSYAAPIDQLVLGLKFGQQLAIAPALAGLLAEAIRHRCNRSGKADEIADLLIPVPLSAARLAQRGFNQALEIARPLAQQLQRPLVPRLLQRCRDTTAQSLLHPDQRQRNVRHAFALNDSDPATIASLRGRHIGVVDDVMTTGATLQEIAHCLTRHGASTVTNYVFARTPIR